MPATNQMLSKAGSHGMSREAAYIHDEFEAIRSLGQTSWEQNISYTPDHKVMEFTRVAAGRPQQRKITLGNDADLNTRLFKNLSELKILTSKFAMHLPQTTRSALFSKLDNILNVDDWHEDDNLVQPASFMTYLRFITFEKNIRSHSAGISNAGNFLAAWKNAEGKITLEFLPNDVIRWSLTKSTADGDEIAAWQGPAKRIKDVLAPYGANGWL